MSKVDLHANVVSYLLGRGWREVSPGGLGALWVGDTGRAVVPNEVPDQSPELDSVVRVLAMRFGATQDEMRSRLRYYSTDITRLAVASDGDSIPLRTARQLLESASAMVRAAAAAARGPRANVPNYSREVREMASSARMGHTLSGSFIVPIYFDLTVVQVEQQTLDENTSAAAPEPSERRMTRTLAEAISAVARRLVDPGVEPTPSAVAEAVNAGVTLQLVRALGNLLDDDNVGGVTATFSWAPALRGQDPPVRQVAIPSEAVPLLRDAEKLLLRRPVDATETFTGPIVEVAHVPGEPVGHFTVQTVRNGQEARVQARVAETQIPEVLEWMRDRRTVVLSGQVGRPAGHLRIDSPKYSALDTLGF